MNVLKAEKRSVSSSGGRAHFQSKGPRFIIVHSPLLPSSPLFLFLCRSVVALHAESLESLFYCLSESRSASRTFETAIFPPLSPPVALFFSLTTTCLDSIASALGLVEDARYSETS